MTKIEKLTHKLRERIHSKEWEQALPSRMHLSTEYGVAPGTISQVFRNLEQEGLVRVLPRKGVIITDTPAASPVTPSNVAVGLRGGYIRLKVPGKEGYTGLIVNQLLDAAHEKGVSVMILQHHEGEGPLTSERCKALGLQGMIYLGGNHGEEAKELCLSGFPVISCNRSAERSPINYVDCDHVGLIHDIVRRYAEAGHQRIAVIMPPTQIPGLLEKLKPHFIDALLTCGIQYDVNPYWVSLAHGEEMELGVKQTDALFDLEEPPTALFCWGYAAVDLIKASLDARCLAIAKDVSVAYTPCHASLHPEVSGYSYEKQDFGKKLLDGLMATIENPFHFLQEELPAEFVDKGSIASPPGVTRT